MHDPTHPPSREELVRELREQQAAGSSPSDLLRYLSAQGITGVHMMFPMQAAFELSLLDAGIIPGWRADGTGEVTDASVNRHLGPLLVRYGAKKT